MTDQRFPKRLRLRTGSEFRRVLHGGRFAADPTLVLHAMARAPTPADDDATPRLGITVPRKTGTAPVRNRWKRLIREAFRIHRDQLPPGFDYVVRPRKGAEPEFHAIRRSLERLARRAAKQRPKGRAGGPPSG